MIKLTAARDQAPIHLNPAFIILVERASEMQSGAAIVTLAGGQQIFINQTVDEIISLISDKPVAKPTKKSDKKAPGKTD